MKDLKTDIKLMSKYSRKDQNNEKNINLKKDILNLLKNKTDKIIRDYSNRNEAGYYRRVAIEFLEDLNVYYGIDVRTTGNTLIIERIK